MGKSFYLEGVIPLQACWILYQRSKCRGISLLVSCKVVNREVYIEGSRTTNVGTDKQELHKRLIRTGKVAHDTNAYNQQFL